MISGPKEVHLYFDRGNIIFGSSNQERLRLANLLFRKKKIDEQQLSQLQQTMHRKGKKFGQIAVEENVMTEEELHDFLKIQVSEIIYDSFTWKEGGFSFWNDSNPPDHAVAISVDLTNLIMESARRMDELEYFTQRLPPDSAVLRTVPNPVVQEKISLSLEEWKVLFLINGKRSLKEICHESTEEILEVYRVVYGLYASRLVEVVQEEDPSKIKTTTLNLHKAGYVEPEPVTLKLLPSDIQLLISSDARITWKEVLKETVAQLTWITPEREIKFPLTDEEHTVGRLDGQSIHITDPSVSNVHARIVRGLEGYMLEDLSSLNGSYINGTPVQRQALVDQDIVNFANVEMIYTLVLKQ